MTTTKTKPTCQACEKESTSRRTRCAECNRMVGRCCWDPYAHKCIKCRDYDRPEDRQDLKAHLKRIKSRRDVLDKAIAIYEKACCAFWDGEFSPDKLASWGVQSDAPSVRVAFDDLESVIHQACEDLGTPEELVEFPTIEFPGFCADGSVDYEVGNLEALELGVGSEAVASASEEDAA